MGSSLMRFFLVNSVNTAVKISRTFKASYRKLKYLLRKNKAIISIARKLSIIIYNILSGNQDFVKLDAIRALYDGKVGKM